MKKGSPLHPSWTPIASRGSAPWPEQACSLPTLRRWSSPKTGKQGEELVFLTASITDGEGSLVISADELLTAKVEASFSPLHNRDGIILIAQTINPAVPPEEELVFFN